jgi:small conductance mechanosensitive channel
MERFWQDLQTHAVTYAGRGLGAVAILLVGWLALPYLTAPLRRVLGRTRLDPAVSSLLVHSARGLLLAVIVVGVLQQLGVETASLLTVLAAAGLTVALSLQTTLANFAAGLVLLAFGRLRSGDVIEVGGLRGRVTDIFPFHLVLVTDDNQTAEVPHVLLTGGGFRNHTALPVRRVEWTLPLRPADDLAAVKEALRTRLLADPRVLREPPPRAFVREWGDDRLVLAVQAWTVTADRDAVQEELLEALGLELAKRRADPGAGR